MLDGFVIGAAKASGKRVEAENERRIVANHRGGVRRGQRQMMIAGQRSPNRSGECERERNVGAIADGYTRKPLGRFSIVMLPSRPLQEMALLVAPRGKGVCCRVAGLDLQRFA